MFFNLIFSFFCLYMPRRAQKNASRRKAKKSTKPQNTTLNKLRGSFTVASRGTDVQPQSGQIVRWGNKSSSVAPWPEVYYAKMTYCTRIVLSGTTGGITAAGHSFRLNGLYDPDLTLTGHQPYGFDQISPLYGRYAVYGASVTLTVYNNINPDAALCWRIYGSQDTYNFAGRLYEDFVEMPQSGAIVCSIASGGENATTVNLGYIDLAEIDGLSKSSMLEEPAYTSSTTANPTLGVQLMLGVVDLVGTNSPQIKCIVSIVYHTRWVQRKGQQQS